MMSDSTRKLVRRTVLGMFLVTLTVGTFGAIKAKEKAPREKLSKKASLELGKKLFAREWLPNDPRSHGGDGLGPVFNDSSCIACHNLGGAGGAGPVGKNVDIVSASTRFGVRFQPPEPSLGEKFVRSIFGLESTSNPQGARDALEARRQMERDQLAKIHPGFRASKSVVLHRFGIDPKYAAWRQKMAGGIQFATANPIALPVESVLTPVDFAIDEQKKITALQSRKSRRTLKEFEKVQRANQQIKQVRAELGMTEFSRRSFQQNATITTTQRNPIALFGGGLIDSIPDRVIENAAKMKNKEFPEIEGRVCRLKDGRIGRFGWKAQKASLYDFAMTACAVELGLHVPDQPQSGVPLQPDYQPTGLDMNQAECNALVAYLKYLPAPVAHKSSNKKEAEYLSKGLQLFTSTGCAACHTPKLGKVAGIYSDLLVHDIGQDMVDTGEYGVFQPTAPNEDVETIEVPLADADTSEGTTPNQQVQTKSQIVGALQAEWRTPPLWGVRDSAPYLHDGRAQTLKQAIAFHGGEGKNSAIRFFSLTPQEQQKVVAFLKSLTAPGLQQPAVAHSEKLLSRSSR
jgi:CxxC motif-containing protein (DUF1111 family)